MAGAYLELTAHAALIEKVVRSEEERFLETLARGLVLFEEEARRVRSAGGHTLAGDVAFRLYDTYGFPLDLTADLAKDGGLLVDEAGFQVEMERQKAKARQAWAEALGDNASVIGTILDSGIATEFTGYETLEDSGTVRAIIKDGKQVSEALAGDSVEIVTDRTPFYGESGGQVGDHGVISVNGTEVEVDDTIKPLPDLILHRGHVKSGVLHIGERVILKVLPNLRQSIMANHSATHLLQWALRQVLGDHVKQSGSLVDADRMRFDFTHFSPISVEEIARVEYLVNAKIRENLEVVARTIPIEEARAAGAMALFGEKYGEMVRMISVGDFSKELCGGTHAKRTGDIGFFKIVSEGGIAAGVRRIEAVTGTGALEYVRSIEEEIRALSERLRGSRGELVPKLEKLIDEKKTREKEVEKLKTKLTSSRTTDFLEGLREIKGVRVLSRLVEDVGGPKDLREYADRVRDRLGSGVALLGAETDGRAILIAIVTRDLAERFHAGHIVKKAAALLGGSGGGRADMAQAGGPDVSKLRLALDSVAEFLD
jgi:alanyl-tRNA synthetase